MSCICSSLTKVSGMHLLFCPPSYPVVSQLQTDLDEGVRADTELLNASFPKFSEGKHMAVDVVRQRLGYHQRIVHLSLHLERTQKREGQYL